MPFPNYFVNGARIVDPPGGALLCVLDPPFTSHMALEVLVHCISAPCELRHQAATTGVKDLLMVGNQNMIYLVVEPGDRLVLNWFGVITDSRYAQGSLYAFKFAVLA